MRLMRYYENFPVSDEKMFNCTRREKRSSVNYEFLIFIECYHHYFEEISYLEYIANTSFIPSLLWNRAYSKIPRVQGVMYFISE